MVGQRNLGVNSNRTGVSKPSARFGRTLQPSTRGRQTQQKTHRVAAMTNSRRNSSVSSSSSSSSQQAPFQSRKEIRVATMNTNGKVVLGLTPVYKLNMFEEYLQSFPDVVFIQDAIEYNDLSPILEKVSDGKYNFQYSGEDDPDNYKPPPPRKGHHGSHHSSDADDRELRKTTAIAWNKDKYRGTPLATDDERLAKHVKWLEARDLSVVKLDSVGRASAFEDMYPSFIAVSWLGADYDKPLRQRIKQTEEFFAFIAELRKNNLNMPILIGGDFNIDLKSFDMRDYPGFVFVPYRPVAGTLAKDLKNTFVFTVDSLQVTESGVKQHHPEIFSWPFVMAKVRGRRQLKIWAVVRLQRACRRWLNRRKDRERNYQRLHENKRRWQRKIHGSGYASDDSAYAYRPPKRRAASVPHSPARSPSPSPSNKTQAHQQTKPRNPRYALYWDPEDDPRYARSNSADPPKSPALSQAEHAYLRRKDFTLDDGRNVMDNVYNERDRALVQQAVTHRRRKFSELKSIEDRRQEDDLQNAMANMYMPARGRKRF